MAATSSSMNGAVSTATTTTVSTSTNSLKLPLTRQRVLSFVEPDGSVRRLEQQANATVSTSRAVPLVNYNNVLYFVDITINEDPVTVILDTGSSDLWISCAYVSGSACSATCPKTMAVITYGSGSVCIDAVFATVQLGSLSLDNYVVGIAQGRNVLPTSSANIIPRGAQGLLGLGHSAIAAIPTPGGQLIDYVNSFSIYLSTTESGVEDSFLLLNGVDSSLIAEQKLVGYTIPLQETTHWTIGMTAFQVGEDDAAVYPCAKATSTNRRVAATPGCRAIVDTGSTLLSMPAALYNAFVKKHLIPNGCYIPRSTGSTSATSTNSIYVCPMDTSLPRLAFTFNNVTFYLDDYTTIVPQSDVVFVELQPMAAASSLADVWVLGDTFLRKFYSSYAPNTSVTLYCASGECATGIVRVGDVPPAAGAGAGTGSLVGGDASGSTTTDNDGTNGNSNRIDGGRIDANGGNSNNSNDSKLSSAALIAIVAGCVLALALLLAAVLGVRRSRRAKHNRDANATANAVNSPATTPSAAFYAANEPLSPLGSRTL